MALEALIARLRGDAATPATPAINEGLQGKPALILGCTPETPATPQKSNTRSFPSVAGVSWRWLIHFPDRNPLEVAFSPEASHAEVLDCYPDALAAEPIEPDRRQPGAPLAGDTSLTGDPVMAGGDRRNRSGNHCRSACPMQAG